MDSRLAIVLAIIVLALVLWAVFGDDPVDATYDDDDEPPPDARAWRDPWGDCE